MINEIGEVGSIFIMDEPSKCDDEKLKKKAKLVRAEFKTVGQYDMPLIKKQKIDLDKVELWNYTKAKQNDDSYKNKTIHFLLMIGTLSQFMKGRKLQWKSWINTMRY
ncbi:MAG: hypothetical protein PHS59_18295 [Paludibacter sp.]|nr:hypothetical protein [Paludibacter sp.]